MQQIVGYRKDRLGARIIALGNLLRLEEKFGVPVHYFWPDAFEGHNMAVETETQPIFEAGFQARYIRQIPEGERPEISDLTDLDQIQRRVGTAEFTQRLQEGERFLCSEGLHLAVFTDESGPEHIRAFRAAVARIVWSDRIQEVLDQATAKLADFSLHPMALHVRRGDVLDKAPWCHKNWTSKFAPDEFYHAVMNRSDAGAVLFSDTPDVVAKMAASHANAFTLEDLVDAPDLSELQRDLVELLLMARCTEIVAPSLSAFSSSASMINGMRLTELPHDLPETERFGAYDTLLDRVIEGPGSFHNEGDFAQSLGYAFRHALNVKRHRELYTVLKRAIEAGQNYAFYYPIAMALAIACGDTDYALSMDSAAQHDKNIWLDDQTTSSALGRVAEHLTYDPVQATSDFLHLYLSRHKSDPDQDALAHYFFTREPVFKYLFQVSDIVKETMSYGRDKERIFLFPVDDNLFDGALNAALPIWIPGGDWPEMFERQQITKNITKNPDFRSKKFQIPAEIREAEAQSFQDSRPLPEDMESLELLSVYSMALMLSGRYRRATALMFHCRNTLPDHPIFLKRLANRFLVTGQTEKAVRNLEQASAVLPKHPGITLVRACIAQERDDHKGAAALLEDISGQTHLPFTLFKAWEMSLRKLKARDHQKAVIAETARRFPGHPIFGKQWAGRL